MVLRAPRLLVLIPLAAALSAQTSEKTSTGAYVRTFSAGATFGYTVKNVMQGIDYAAYDATNIISTSSTTLPRKRPLTGGATVQYAFLEHFAVNAAAMYREVAYQSAVYYYAGTDNSNTAVDERKRTLQEDSTRAVFWDVPLQVRYYSRSHYDPGFRWFGGAGPAARFAGHVRSEHRDENAVNAVTWNNTPTRLAHSVVPGVTAGVGFQWTDPFGIRFVPEVRYSRWLGQPFNSLSTHTARNQIDVVLSVTF